MITAENAVSELKKLSDSRIASHSQRFFKTGPGEYGEGDRFLGIRVPVIRSEVKKFRELPLDESFRLLESEYHEARLFSLLFMVEKFRKAGEEEQKRIYSFYMNNTGFINNWDLVDSSAPYIPGIYLENRDRAVLYKMAGSDYLFDRRIAIMSTFHFIRIGDFRDTLAISDMLISDREDLIHKAVGWMLRETGNRSPETELSFLNTRYKNMPRTMLRYAIEKLDEPLRKAYLNGEI